MSDPSDESWNPQKNYRYAIDLKRAGALLIKQHGNKMVSQRNNQHLAKGALITELSVPFVTSQTANFQYLKIEVSRRSKKKNNFLIYGEFSHRPYYF